MLIPVQKARRAINEAKRDAHKATKAKAKVTKAAQATSLAGDLATLPLKTDEPTKKRKMDPVKDDLSPMKHSSSVSPVKTPKKIKQYPSQGVAETEAGPRPESLKRKRIKARPSIDLVQTRRGISSGQKVKPKRSRKEKV